MPKSSEDSKFPLRLKNAREIRTLTQSDLASRAGLQPSAVSHFESGTRKPSFANLRRLADALNVSTDYLLGRADALQAEASTDVMYRDYGRLSDSNQEQIRMMIEMMKGKESGKKS
jgi:transcriptional regulator with XRE-family HTH domain